MDNVTPITFLYTVLASQRSTPGPDFKKNYLTLMHLCHRDRHPGFDRHISQQLIAVHNILIDPVTRKNYDCSGLRAVMRKDTTHFRQMCNPRPPYECLDDLWNWLLPWKSISNHSTMTHCADAFFKEGCNITNTNRKHFLFRLRKGQCNISFRSFNFLSAYFFPGLSFCKA